MYRAPILLWGEGGHTTVWSGVSREWDLKDPYRVDLEQAREVRDETSGKVKALFDELASTHSSSF